MKTLPVSALRRLQSDLVQAFHEGEVAELPERLVELASRHTRSEMTVWGHRTIDQAHRVRWFPKRLDLSAHDEAYEKLVDQHPVRNRFRETKAPGPYRLSDLISLGDFKRLGLYRDYFRHFGVTRLMAIYLPLGDNTHVSLGVSRGGGDFSDQEMAVLDFLRPYLAKAYSLAARLEHTERLLAATDEALLQARRGLVVLSPGGRVEHVTPAAARWSHDVAGLIIAPFQPLPLALCEALHRAGNGRTVLSGRGGQLRVQRIKRAAGDLLIVQAPRPPEQQADFIALGLTPRESEVLVWLCEGKTNAEIAIVTRSATGTVKKHLENIYAKLGVENRAAAVRLALDLVES